MFGIEVLVEVTLIVLAHITKHDLYDAMRETLESAQSQYATDTTSQRVLDQVQINVSISDHADKEWTFKEVSIDICPQSNPVQRTGYPGVSGSIQVYLGITEAKQWIIHLKETSF